MFYPYILLIHLLCAIFFIGYLFVDIFILGILKKKNSNLDQELFKTIGVKIMPFIVIILLLSGGVMMPLHTNPLNLLFLIKIFFVGIILLLVVFSLFYYFILKRKNPLGNFIHLLVFILCLGIVILAKLMNYFFISL
ncbi:hypothetical protein [Campylobacter taeniopygiae]|uniref:Copper resistance protein CopD n=1 Tax=Campylobacter taeniopygiae TaxID=2510188 RepID=A0ABY2TJY7_9BACT|nr:hypothetical protein [Campylobacter taeniopygiae]TKX34168.1 hypothetical protein CQA75_03425 [Campylobacter taeniopygiae]